MSDDPPPRELAIQLLRDEIATGLDFVEALDRKLALVPAFLASIGVVAAPGSLSSEQAPIATSGLLVAIVAVVISLVGLAGAGIEVGPEQRWLSRQAASPDRNFHREIADRLRLSVESLHAATKRKAKCFNLALLAGVVATLLMVIARSTPGGG